MDLRKLKTLIDLVAESGISELEVTEGEGKVRIVKAPPQVLAQPMPMQAAPALAAAPAPAPTGAAIGPSWNQKSTQALAQAGAASGDGW